MVMVVVGRERKLGRGLIYKKETRENKTLDKGNYLCLQREVWYK